MFIHVINQIDLLLIVSNRASALNKTSYSIKIYFNFFK